MSTIDFLAIGDITTDAFIRVNDAEVVCDKHGAHCKLCLRFGDKIPYEFVEVVKSVGNSANAAVSAARLGLKSALVAHLGDDDNGHDCLTALRQNGVSIDHMQVEAGKQTNYHYVLWHEADRTILVKHQPFKYLFPANIAAPRWVYLSSLGEHTESYHHNIEVFLKRHPQTKLAFQPGTFQMSLGTDKLAELYKRSEVFIVNVEEAQKILKTETREILTLLKGLQKLGPHIVVITDGPKGAYFYTEGQAWFMPPYPDPKPPYERTGAGDAFASTFVAALAMGKTLEEAMKWAPINSMSVVQHIGAQKGLLTEEALRGWLSKGPKDYLPKKLS